MTDLVLIAHNLRSTHNVGSLLRTAEGIGVGQVWLTGYSPYPLSDEDTRLPHEARKLDAQIKKTALGAETLVHWQQTADVTKVIVELKAAGFTVAGLEQAAHSVPLPGYRPPEKIAVIVGREVEGLEAGVQALCDVLLEIPMFGQKESFNVVQAAAMALYHLRFRGD